MEDLITLKSFSLNELGNPSFTLQLAEDVTPAIIDTITLRKKDYKVEGIKVSDFEYDEDNNTLEINQFSNIYVEKISGHFSVNDISFIIVELKEADVQERLFRIGSSECTAKYRTIILPLYDLTPLRVRALRLYENSVDCSCEFSKEFIDAILKIEALELALKLRNIDAADRLINALTGASISPIKGCGCHGH